MVARSRPTSRRMVLGSELRKMRTRMGLTLWEAAEKLSLRLEMSERKGISEATLQRVETGLSSFRRANHLEQLLDLYGVTGRQEVSELLEINREAALEDWVAEYKDSSMPPLLSKFVLIEEAALRIRAFHPLLPWGFLQTEAFAREIFAMQQPALELTTEATDKGVRLRRRRLECITREDDPVRFHAVIGEPALRHVVGSIEVMQEQAETLISLSALAHVTIQFLPSTGRRYRFTDNFSILDMGPDLPAQVQYDSALGDLSLSGKPRSVGVCSRRFEQLAMAALAPEETPEFIRTMMREMTHDPSAA